MIKRDIHPEGCTKTMDGMKEHGWGSKQIDKGDR
jgi:hypothetical protein